MVDWGSIPEWVAAVGTVGAFAIALWLLGAQLRTYRASEQNRIQRDATRVSAWWSTSESMEVGLRERLATRRAPEHLVTVHIRNSGENPIYDCIVYLGPTREPPPGVPTREPPPGGGGREDAWDFHFPIVPGGQTLTASTPSAYFTLEPQDHWPDEQGFYRGPWVEVVFTDSAGRHWRRTKRGQLTQRESPSVES
jgi:hypothetical protein